jgi:trehalose/maltose hydrolase-like predicted phosphorylase
VLARAHRDRALAFLAEVAASDVEDTHGGTTAEGVHLAAMVGGADLLQRCFAGVEPRLDSLYVSPSWPAELGRATFAVRYQGSDLHLTVSPTRVRVEAEPGGAGTVLVTCGARRSRSRPGGRTRSTSPARALRWPAEVSGRRTVSWPSRDGADGGSRTGAAAPRPGVR